MIVREKFIALTNYLHTYGYEDELINMLPPNVLKDEAGNYYLEIGQSKSMFTAHLDTVSDKGVQKVNHIIYYDDGKEMVKSDGKSILGADDRSGVLILLYMIEQNTPGLYYFFIGEEGGRKGSSKIALLKPNFFGSYERCISFDRKAYGSVISQQSGVDCCSKAFVQKLVNQLSAHTGYPHFDDEKGGLTDSFSFKHLIANCTNISVGYFYAHSNNECQDISYLTTLCAAVCQVKWEELPGV